MSDKVTEYIEVYRTWKSGHASSKATYNRLEALRKSMTPEEHELLAIRLTSGVYTERPPL